MAKKKREPAGKRYSAYKYETSTMAIDTELADRVKKIAEENGVTYLEMLNQIVKWALRQGEIQIEVRQIAVRSSGRKR